MSILRYAKHQCPVAREGRGEVEEALYDSAEGRQAARTFGKLKT